MAHKTPERGDIWHIKFDPAVGSEMKEDHFCLVISRSEFNKQIGLTMVCPISQGFGNSARNQGFLITLMGCGTKTSGNVHAHQVKTLDLRGRAGKFVEAAPEFLVEQVCEAIQTMLE
jgi:mRNA interferase ChpB